MGMILKATPTAHTTPYLNSNFNDHANFPFSAAYKDETYTGSISSAGSCALVKSNEYNYECDIVYHGFDVSSIPKALLNNVKFNFQIDAWDASNQWVDRGTYETKEVYFALICGGNEILRGDFLSGEYSLLETNRRTFSIDITNLVTLDGLRDFKFRLYMKTDEYWRTPCFKFVGASLNIDYTPCSETVLVPTSFDAQFKCQGTGKTPGTPGTTIADNLAVGGIYLVKDEFRDGQFYNFDYSNFSRFCPIIKAYIKFKAYLGFYVSDTVYSVYVGDTRLEMIHPDVVENSYQTFTIELPELSYNWLKDLKFVVQGKASDSGTVAISFYGVELHIFHGDPEYRGHIATGHATNYLNPDLIADDEESGFTKITYPSRLYREPPQSDYAELNALRTTRGNVYLLDFNFIPFEGIELDKAVIDRIDIRSHEYWLYTYNAPVSYYLYLGDTILREFSYQPSGGKVYYTRQMVVDGLNITAADLPNLKVKFKFRNISSGQNASARISGTAVDLWAGSGLPEPELPTIVETVVKGDYSKNVDAYIPSKNVKPNETPNTEGYIGNLYNDNLDDYAEFTYTPSSSSQNPEPEPDIPGERPYESIVVNSPKLSTLGIPAEAKITRVVLTEESYVYSSDSTAEAELGLYINSTNYSTKSFTNSSNFSKSTFDTGEISFPKAAIQNDVVTFQIRWYSLGADFTYRVKYLLWDITFEVSGVEFKCLFADGDIKAVNLGNNSASAMYLGTGQLF